MNRDEAEQSVPILTDAEIVGEHVVLGFSDGMTVVFREQRSGNYSHMPSC